MVATATHKTSNRAFAARQKDAAGRLLEHSPWCSPLVRDAEDRMPLAIPETTAPGGSHGV